MKDRIYAGATLDVDIAAWLIEAFWFCVFVIVVGAAIAYSIPTEAPAYYKNVVPEGVQSIGVGGWVMLIVLIAIINSMILAIWKFRIASGEFRYIRKIRQKDGKEDAHDDDIKFANRTYWISRALIYIGHIGYGYFVFYTGYVKGMGFNAYIFGTLGFVSTFYLPVWRFLDYAKKRLGKDDWNIRYRVTDVNDLETALNEFKEKADSRDAEIEKAMQALNSAKTSVTDTATSNVEAMETKERETILKVEDTVRNEIGKVERAAAPVTQGMKKIAKEQTKLHEYFEKVKKAVDGLADSVNENGVKEEKRRKFIKSIELLKQAGAEGKIDLANFDLDKVPTSDRQ